MAIPFLKRIIFSALQPYKPLFSFSSISDQTETIISTVVSILTHHRSKSRWNHLRSLYPSGFTPNQCSQIILLIKNKPHLALNFFLYTRNKSLCNHNLISYSTMIHVLSRSRFKTQAQSLIRTAIRVSESDSIDGDDVRLSKPFKVFESLVRTYKECDSAPFVFDLLIKACIESKKIDEAVEIMRMLRSRGIGLRVSTCNSLIVAVSQCRGPVEGFAVYREVFWLDGGFGENGKRGIKVCPNVQTFNALMVCFYQDGAMEKVEEIWVDMAESGCVANVHSYSVLMAALCEERRMEEAQRLWEEMKVKKIDPDNVAYNTIIGGFCEIGDIERAEEFFREMELNGVESTCTSYEHLIKGYSKIMDVDSAILFYKDMCRKDFRPEGSTIDVLIAGLCDNRRISEALEILRFALSKSGFSPCRKSYEILVNELCEEGMMEEALKLQADMMGKGFEPDEKIYEAFIDGYTRQGNQEVAGKLRKEMVENQERGRVDGRCYLMKSEVIY